MHSMARRRGLLLLPSFLALAACAPRAPEVRRFGGQTMGSTYEVKFVGEVPMQTVRDAVVGLLDEFDRAFNLWRDDSEISRLNAAPASEPFPVSERFGSLLAFAIEISRATDGAFDPTVGPLLEIYRAARDDPEHRLDERALDAARARVGYRRVHVEDGAVRRDAEGIVLDLDGVVAGACLDELAARLDRLGVPGFYLDVTGEVYCRGEKAPGVPWRIGVVDPRAGPLGTRPIVAIALRDRSLCTSGDYRNGFVSGGRRVHHIFDPRTGRNAPHDVVSVSVLAKRAALADALGTAFLVLGVEGTREVLPRCEAYGELGVLFLRRDGKGGLLRHAIGWPGE